jgi:hypothetical protein
MNICKISYIDKNGNPTHCTQEATHADPSILVAAEERWAMTVCREHYLKGANILHPEWVSYPDKHATVTNSKENKMNNQKAFTLDELLSPAALADLNGVGSYVNFSIQNEDGSVSLGWFSRKKKTTVEFERVVISTLTCQS